MKVLHAIEVRIETIPAHCWIPEPGDQRVTVEDYVKMSYLNEDEEPIYGVGLDILGALVDLAGVLQANNVEVNIFSFPAGS
jgi:hypothetical protein